MKSTFWDRIEIKMSQDDDLQQPDHLDEIVPFFLECTRGGPFSFTLCINEGYPEAESYDIRPVLVDLINHSAHWEEASIHLSSIDLVFLCATKTRLSLLKKLDIVIERDSVYHHTQSMIPTTVSDIFQDAPLLKQAVLQGPLRGNSALTGRR